MIGLVEDKFVSVTHFPATFDSLKGLKACFNGLFVLFFVKVLVDAFMGRYRLRNAAVDHVCIDDLVRGLDLVVLFIGVLVLRERLKELPDHLEVLRGLGLGLPFEQLAHIHDLGLNVLRCF